LPRLQRFSDRRQRSKEDMVRDEGPRKTAPGSRDRGVAYDILRL
jgi:hypothetical protein